MPELDAIGVPLAGPIYVIGILTTALALLPLALDLWRATYRRLAALTLALFVGIATLALGGGLVVLVGFGALALRPSWFAHHMTIEQRRAWTRRGPHPSAYDVAPMDGTP